MLVFKLAEPDIRQRCRRERICEEQTWVSRNETGRTIGLTRDSDPLCRAQGRWKSGLCFDLQYDYADGGHVHEEQNDRMGVADDEPP